MLHICVYIHIQVHVLLGERGKVDETLCSQLRDLEKYYFSRVTVVSIVSILLFWFVRYILL